METTKEIKAQNISSPLSLGEGQGVRLLKIKNHGKQTLGKEL